jgi:23S rRNA pseudouridine2457 synthase
MVFSNLRGLMSSFIYIAFNKPYGVLSQFSGEKLDETLSNFGLPKDVYAVGRLDKDSEGLLILSNDGPFIDTLLSPKSDKEKTYWVQVEKIPDTESLLKLSRGVLIEDYKTKTCKVRILEPRPEIAERNPPVRFRKTIPTCWLEITISEGKNRQVRKMTASVGHPTLRLIRVKVGKYGLGDLKIGEWKMLKREDIL